MALLGALALSASGLKADMAGAQAAYKRGMDKDKLKDYQGAMSEYQAALAAEPRYAYAWRQIGNDRYYLGDKAGALEAYDKYLAVVKNDPRTQAFADRLRSQLGATAAVAPAAAASPSEEEMRQWRVGATLGYETVGFSAYNEDWKSIPMAAGSDVPKVSSGLSLGGVVGYRLMPKLELGLDLDYSLVSVTYRASYTYGPGATSQTDTTENFNTLWVGPRVSYDLLIQPKVRLGALLGVGYMTMMGAGEDSKTSYSWLSQQGKYSASYSGSTVGFKLGATGLWKISQLFYVNMDLAYRLATIGKVARSWSSSPPGGTTTNGSDTYQRFGLSSSGDMPFDYSGLDFKMGANLCF
jgi:hypothetical protein